MYHVENTAGDILASRRELDEAVKAAKALLEDDPELRELTVALYEPLRTVTFGPDADWQSVVVVLKPGEKIQPPGDSRWRDEDIEAYEFAARDGVTTDLETGEEFPAPPSDPKHPDYHDTMAAVWDERDKLAEKEL